MINLKMLSIMKMKPINSIKIIKLITLYVFIVHRMEIEAEEGA